MQMKPEIVEESRPLADSLLKNWLEFRKFLRLALSDQPITRQHDQAFLEIKSAISRNFSQIRSRLPRQLTGSPERMQDLMKSALSVTSVRNMPTADRRNLYSLWHGFYIELCRTVGALKFMTDERYYPKFEEKVMKAGANLKASMVEEQGKKKKKR